MRLPLMIAVLSAIAFSAMMPAAETFILNAKTTTPALSDDDLKDIFLGRRTAWSAYIDGLFSGF